MAESRSPDTELSALPAAAEALDPGGADSAAGGSCAVISELVDPEDRRIAQRIADGPTDQRAPPGWRMRTLLRVLSRFRIG